jgi:hypothetical protein
MDKRSKKRSARRSARRSVRRSEKRSARRSMDKRDKRSKKRSARRTGRRSGRRSERRSERRSGRRSERRSMDKRSEKIIFPDFLEAIKSEDMKVLRQAKKQNYKINIYWLIENNKNVSKKMMDYLLKNGMIKKSTKNLGLLLDEKKIE